MAKEGKPIMGKTPFSPIQRDVNSVLKAVKMLDERPTPSPKLKLDGRRGYGDGDIPVPSNRNPDHT
jgi:hypothetical protein